MKYHYTVKHNGVWYPAGAEVPVGEQKKPEEVVVEEKVEEVAKPLITKTDIARMNRSEISKVAEENGIDVSEEMTAREIKDEVIKKLEL